MAFNTVDTTGFDEAIQSFQKALEAYTGARITIANQTKNLINQWEGAGGDKFKSVTNKILRALDDDGESLQYIIDNLIDIKASYAEWDAEMAGKLQGGGQV